MSRKKIERAVLGSTYRPLLSDTLPYETPHIFSNSFFFKLLESGEFHEHDPVTNGLFGTKDKHRVKYTIPYNYEANASSSKTRLLSVLHPLSQIEIAGFYEQYFAMIIDRTSISKTSLRHPAALSRRLSSSSYSDFYLDAGQKEEIAAPSTYFVVEPYNRLYEFYESRDFLLLESRFSYCTTFDISKCFYNVYTHSIAWAVKGRDYAKAAKSSYSFENTFDKLMQFANFGETNGIVVGPEVSRIFAEVVLQKIDILSVSELEKRDIRFDIDYVVRRYVDDYFVFSNNAKIGADVQKTFEKHLGTYKLYVNQEKIAQQRRPLSSGITSAKLEIFDIVSKFFSDYSHIFSLPSSSHRSEIPFTYTTREFFRRFQSALKKHELDYSDLSSLLLGTLRYRLYVLLTGLKASSQKIERTQDLIRFQISILQLTFYLVSMDCRQRLVDIAAQILLLLRDFADGHSTTSKRVLDENIQIEFSKTFLSGHSQFLASRAPLEFCSLLIVIENVCEHWHISQEVLLNFWQACDDEKEQLKDTTPFRYFEAMCLLYFCGGQDRYADLREQIVKVFIGAINKTEFQKYCCLTMAAVDLIACPHLSEEQKTRIGKAVTIGILGKTTKTNARAAGFRKASSAHSWFIDWHGEIDVSQALFEKELRAAYR